MDRATQWLVSIGRTDQWGDEPHSTNPKRVAQFEGFARGGGLWIAEAGGAVVGVLSVGDALPYVPPAEEPELYVQLLIADRSSPVRGVGAALLEHARTLAVARGVRLLRLDCFAGGDGALVRYYEKQGFTRTQTFSVALPDREWPGQILVFRF
ncbi:MAG: GNAT family N-acetyltransferase [Hamadaea sp.]|nr:GNAT family N-acetyltransferase [Hamadaea sp.]